MPTNLGTFFPQRFKPLDFRMSKGQNMISTSAGPVPAGEPYTKAPTSSSGSSLGTIATGASDYTLPSSGGTRDVASYLRADYQKNRQKYDKFLQSMLDARFGEDLVKEVRPTVAREAEKARGTRARDLSRYGATLTPVEQQEMERQSQRQESLALGGALTNTRTLAKDLRQGYLSDLSNLGSIIKQGGLERVMGLEETIQAGRQAKSQNRAAYKSNLLNTIGTATVLGIMGGI